MLPRTWPLLIVVVLFASAAHVGDSFAQTTPGVPERGQLLENPPPQLGFYSPSDLISHITDGTVSRWLLRWTFSPRCSVVVYQLRYGTVGGQGEPTTASAALMVPAGSDAACVSPRPIVLYAHGKRNLTFFNMADLSGSNYEGLIVALALAGDGYIVVAPNYAGYDTSTLGYHPFMNADQQAADMMDALAAARVALPSTSVADNQKLFITGYSEGGYVAMATHRALEAAGIPVTASAPMSGPYALVAFSDAMFMGQVGRGAVEEILMLGSSYQHAYGNIDSSGVAMFEAKYASAATLLPGMIGTGTLVAEGLIPASAVFSSTPPLPELAWMTPAAAPGKLASVFAQGFGTDNLITNDYRLSYLQDAFSAPDGGYPNTTTGLPPDAPANLLRQALKQNDLRNWAPVAPTLLCAGDEDPVVFYLNTQLMQGYWAVTAPESPVTVLDIDAPPSHDGPYKHLRKKFAETKSLMRWIEGRSAVVEDYHDVLVPAFCLQASKSFFDGF
ncbi:alpha/beta hydrolase family protein [Steroidobacter flavus]|uniref:Alpha/beta hydrolase family protein n=1 Tax=Steroidobacter flavus TaxID=1842136 RepID=A0ABV8SV51_9GAMM